MTSTYTHLYTRCMATLQTTTDLLLQRTVNQTLDEFITEHMDAGGDPTSLLGALMMATGQMYDRRTVTTWINKTKDTP